MDGRDLRTDVAAWTGVGGAVVAVVVDVSTEDLHSGLKELARFHDFPVTSAGA